jgi:hypothetical protein
MARRTAILLGALGLPAFAAGVIGCGRSQPQTPPPVQATKAGVEAALLARLEGKDLSVEWVVCTDEGASFQGRPVYRCNVNFGDPHIEGYCAVVEGGKLVTHVERPELRCGRERTPEGVPQG